MDKSKIEQFVRFMITLSDDAKMKNYIKQMALHYDYAKIKKIKNDYAISAFERNPPDHADHEILIKPDIELEKSTEQYLSRRPEILSVTSREDAFKHANALNAALDKCDGKSYSKYFPRYISSLKKLKEVFEEISNTQTSENKRTKRGSAITKNKTEIAIELIKEFNPLVEKAGDHEEALAKIKEKVPEFRWKYGTKELYKKTANSLNKSLFSKVLADIAMMRKVDPVPDHETFRKTL